MQNTRDAQIKTTKISVIICTYNRCHSLKTTLDSLLLQECDGSFNYEIIIADNNSKDETRNVFLFYEPLFKGNLKYVFVSEQGQTYARNRGINEAEGEIVAFIDDDVLPVSNWLASIYNGFRAFNCDMLGGRIFPLWKEAYPKWLTKKFWGMLALLDYGEKAFDVTSKDFQLFGANFSFKRKLFDEVGFFNTSLGRSGSSLMGADDSEMFFRLLRRNKEILYYPDAAVFHNIESRRLNKKYLKRWQFYSARSNYIIRGGFTFSNIFAGSANRIISFLWCLLKGDTENRVYHEVRLFYYVGLNISKLEDILGKKKYAKS